jgi:hypothetical protein
MKYDSIYNENELNKIPIKIKFTLTGEKILSTFLIVMLRLWRERAMHLHI